MKEVGMFCMVNKKECLGFLLVLMTQFCVGVALGHQSLLQHAIQASIVGLVLIVLWIVWRVFFVYRNDQCQRTTHSDSSSVSMVSKSVSAVTASAVDVNSLPAHDVIPLSTDKIKKKILPNGLTVLVFQQPSAPKVLVQIGYDVGSAIEGAGERGLAHLLEHMIFKGTDLLTEGDIDGIGRKYGADFNAFTSNDMTSYFFEVDSQNWQHFVPILADCMKNARFSDQHLASEVKAVIQELRMYKDDHWGTMLEHAFSTMFPANHPYHHPIIGYKEDLADLSGARLKAFYDKYYHPTRAVLCIVGDVDFDDAFGRAEDAFGSITSTASDHTPEFIPLQNQLKTSHAIIYRDVQDEQLGLYWRIPGMNAGDHLVVSALEYILGGGRDSRLYRVLVDELQIATSVRVCAEHMMAAGVLFVMVEPHNGQRDACLVAVREQMALLLEHGCSEIELYKMVKNRQRQHMLALHNLTDFVYHWLESYFVTRDECAFFHEANEYASLTQEQLNKYVQEWLQPRDMSTVVVAPLIDNAQDVWHEEQEKEEEYYAYLLERHKRTEPLAEPVFVHTLPPAKPLAFTFPEPTRVSRQLTGEMTVISYTDRTLPLVSVALLFKDAAYIARALEGLGVDLMMALLVEGGNGKSKQQIVELFDIHGAQYAYSGRGMSLLVGTNSFAVMLKHALTVLVEPAFSVEAFEKIRAIFVHSYTQKKDSATSLAMRTLKQAIYYKHPYGWSFDDAISYLKSLTLDDIVRLHETYVRPSHMVCSVAGDIEPAFVEQLLVQFAAHWRSSHYVPPVYPEIQVPEKSQVELAMLRDQVVLMMGRRSSVSLYEPTHIILDLLSHMSFNSLGSRLYGLRERTGLFYTASGAWGADIHQEDGFDYISVLVSPENVGYARDAITALLHEMQSDGFTHDELAAARQMYCKEMIDAAADVRSLASLFANIEVLGIGFDYYDKALRYAYEVGLDDINAYAREYISPERFVSVTVGRLVPPEEQAVYGVAAQQAPADQQ